jgi:hypothetical protein
VIKRIEVVAMRETIRFAWGISSLGDFVVAMSEKGVVALEFSSMHTAMENALRIRFPDADLERSQEDLAGIMEVVAGAIDDPARGCDLSLDLSGTAYEVRIWLMLRPPSRTGNVRAISQRGAHAPVARKRRSCVYRKLDPDVLVMKSAEYGMRFQCAETLDWTTDRRVFVKGSVGASFCYSSAHRRGGPGADAPRHRR